MLEVVGSSSEVVFHALPIDDPVRRCPDISLAKRELGWEPKISLRDGIERLHQAYLEHGVGA